MKALVIGVALVGLAGCPSTTSPVTYEQAVKLGQLLERPTYNGVEGRCYQDSSAVVCQKPDGYIYACRLDANGKATACGPVVLGTTPPGYDAMAAGAILSGFASGYQAA